jgi:hypothetical protein
MHGGRLCGSGHWKIRGIPASEGCGNQEPQRITRSELGWCATSLAQGGACATWRLDAGRRFDLDGHDGAHAARACGSGSVDGEIRNARLREVVAIPMRVRLKSSHVSRPLSKATPRVGRGKRSVGRIACGGRFRQRLEVRFAPQRVCCRETRPAQCVPPLTQPG